MASTDENIEWAERKAKDIWQMAGGSNTFTTPVERRMHYCFAKVMVGNGEAKNLEVHCKSAKDMSANRPLIVVPPEILREWEKMGVDYKSSDDLFRSRPNGGQGGNPNAQWCLLPTGDDRISIWAQNIAKAVEQLEGGDKLQENEPMKCWLVVWNWQNLYVDKFFAEVGDRKEKISVWLQDEDVKKGDKGVIVVREQTTKPHKLRAVYATFTVTDNPQKMKDTHPEFWKHEDDKDEDKKRVLVRFDPRFVPITSIASNTDLKMRRQDYRRWVRQIPCGVYEMVREHAVSVRVED